MVCLLAASGEVVAEMSSSSSTGSILFLPDDPALQPAQSAVPILKLPEDPALRPAQDSLSSERSAQVKHSRPKLSKAAAPGRWVVAALHCTQCILASEM